MSAVSDKHLGPRAVHIAVIYALAEMALGREARNLTPSFHAAHGWGFYG